MVSSGANSAGAHGILSSGPRAADSKSICSFHAGSPPPGRREARDAGLAASTRLSIFLRAPLGGEVCGFLETTRRNVAAAGQSNGTNRGRSTRSAISCSAPRSGEGARTRTPVLANLGDGRRERAFVALERDGARAEQASEQAARRRELTASREERADRCPRSRELRTHASTRGISLSVRVKESDPWSAHNQCARSSPPRAVPLTRVGVRRGAARAIHVPSTDGVVRGPRPRGLFVGPRRRRRRARGPRRVLSSRTRTGSTVACSTLWWTRSISPRPPRARGHSFDMRAHGGSTAMPSRRPRVLAD